MSSLLKEIIFRLVHRYLSFIDRHRTEYFLFAYRDKIRGGQGLQMGKGSHISVISGDEKSFIKFGKDVLFRKFCAITLDYAGVLEIGDRNFFNNSCSITCINSIRIGEGNLFGEDVKIYDHNHVYEDINAPIRNQGFAKGEVVIGNNCWIGSNCIILNNVTIGDNSVIGANNLIYKSIPAGSLVKSNSLPTVINRI